MKKLIAFFKEEEGLETPEYAVMGTLLILGISGAVILLAGGVTGAINAITAVLAG